MLNYCDLNYWKAVDSIKHTENLQHLIKPQFAVFDNYVENTYRLCCVAWNLHHDLHTITADYPRKELEAQDYYRLTGVLDVSDYNSVEEETEEVDQYILAPRAENVLYIAGFWPEYDASGTKQWHWIAGPDIVKVEDVQDVINNRLKGLLGGLYIIHNGQTIDLDDDNVRLEGWL